MKIYIKRREKCPTNDSMVKVTLNLVNYYSKLRCITGVQLYKNNKAVHDTGFNYIEAIKKVRLHKKEISNEKYASEINHAKKKCFRPIENADKFNKLIRNRLKNVQKSLYLKQVNKIDRKYKKGLYLFSIDDGLKMSQQKIDDMDNSRKYASHNFNEPRSIRPNDVLTMSYWVYKDCIPNKARIFSTDFISFLRKKRTYKIIQ